VVRRTPAGWPDEAAGCAAAEDVVCEGVDEVGVAWDVSSDALSCLNIFLSLSMVGMGEGMGEKGVVVCRRRCGDLIAGCENAKVEVAVRVKVRVRVKVKVSACQVAASAPTSSHSH
jgi:hypothetical protein